MQSYLNLFQNVLKKSQIHLGSDWVTCREQQSYNVYCLSSLQKLCIPGENRYRWL